MDYTYSFTREVVVEGRRYTVIRPPTRLDPADDVYRTINGHRASYRYILSGRKRSRAAVASTEAKFRRLLPEVRAGDAASSECAVCLQDYAAEEKVRAMPVCGHAFHLRCISEWLSHKAVCPICRCELPLPLPTQQKQEEEEDPEPEEEDDEDDEPLYRRGWNWIRVPLSARDMNPNPLLVPDINPNPNWD